MEMEPQNFPKCKILAILEKQKFLFSMFYSKPWIRKVRTSRGHLSVERRTILETWYTFYFFRNKTFLFVKIDS